MKFSEGFPVRLRFMKRGKVRFISHRDVARAFERAFRIEELPLAFTLGFSPRPKVSFGLALSVGHESIAEYLDFELSEAIETDTLPERLSAALPQGIDVTGAVPLVERALALQEAVTLVEYRVVVADDDFEVVDHAVLAPAVDHVMASTTVPVTRTRKGRESVDDIRPALQSIELGSDDDGSPALELTLSTNNRGARPREVLDALSTDGIVLTERRVLRIAQWIERDGARLEPLEADAFARTLEVRAS
ncbi:MAG: TIGR03936 family radical SAM-associated protein [Acidimicrobiia bacterium]